MPTPKPLLLLAALTFAGLLSAQPKPPEPAFAPVVDEPGLPRVLLLGDSISIGYTLPVRAALKGRANVHRPATNCSSTGYALTELDHWLGQGKWDVIHFNFGLHDAKLPPEGVRHAPPELYEKNLREIVRRLKATGAKLVWASTTPVPLGGNLAPNRRFGDVAVYNAIAKKIMEEQSVPIDDLNAAMQPQVAKFGRPRDVHFSPEGSAFLAQHVALSIQAQLPDKITPSALESSPGGWVDLLAETPLAGWVRVSLPTTKPLSDSNPWSYNAGQGVLRCAGTGIHEMLLHPQEQADGVLHVEWRYVGNHPKPNSGIFVRTFKDNSVWHQAQLAATSPGVIFGAYPGADGKPTRLTAGLRRPDLLRSAGEWNVMEITTQGSQGSLWFNGVLVAQTDALAAPAGFVGFEAEGSPIEFRRVKFKALHGVTPTPITYKKGDRLRPRPSVVTPPVESSQETPGRPPSDAIVLFDGKDLTTHWMEFNPRGQDDPSRPPLWIVKDGYTQAAGNQIQTREKYTDCHLHIEWVTSPEDAAAPGKIDQKRGNSGLELEGHPEIQILDSYENDTYPDGQAAAIYGYWPPRVNASRPPGQWQSYDLYYTAPRFTDGKKTVPATYTLLHNGLPVHLGAVLPGDAVDCRIRLRPHGGAVRFRNMWVRPLHAYDENAGQPLPADARTTKPW